MVATEKSMNTTSNMDAYLAHSTYIDWQHLTILAKAKALAGTLTCDTDIARACFEYVRDDIKHSWDYKLNPVTCKASEVLEHGTGYCYAKSHLLAALLRANNIPAGLCYQRLTIDDDQPPFCLHGLNAVYLQNYGWYRIDARGNKAGVHADFCPPQEKIAFPVQQPGEYDLPCIYSEPLPAVIDTLTTQTTFEDVAATLPDILTGIH